MQISPTRLLQDFFSAMVESWKKLKASSVFRRLSCVRIKIESVSCTKINLCACHLVFFTTDLQTVNYYSTIHC